ncbi:MAG: hypothetical protein WCP91_03605 [Candidatus Berkelbacteria bacterium]
MVEDEKVATPAPAPAAPAKKSNATTIIIIVVVALVVLGVGGTLISRWVARKAADKITSGILSSATGSNVSVNSDSGTTSVSNGSGTTSVGSNVKWPTDMPASVPKLTVGTLTMSTSDKTSNSWSVLASDISQAQFDTYKASVVSAGWTNTATTSFGADILTYDKDSNSLTLTYDPSSNGLSVTVTTKSE